MHVLVTRPLSDAERTAGKLRAGGCQVTLAPLLQLEIVEAAALGDGPWEATVMTSANAVRAVLSHPRLGELTARPLYVVGRRTREAAQFAGFTEVISPNGNVADLARLIAAHARGPLLYLAGADRAGDLAGELADRGAAIDVKTVVVYRAAAVSAFPHAVAAALAGGAIDGVLHFSRRSAAVYLSCAHAAGILDSALRPSHYCLSDVVAEPLRTAGAARIEVARRPEELAHSARDPGLTAKMPPRRLAKLATLMLRWAEFDRVEA